MLRGGGAVPAWDRAGLEGREAARGSQREPRAGSAVEGSAATSMCCQGRRLPLGPAAGGQRRLGGLLPVASPTRCAPVPAGPSAAAQERGAGNVGLDPPWALSCKAVQESACTGETSGMPASRKGSATVARPSCGLCCGGGLQASPSSPSRQRSCSAPAALLCEHCLLGAVLSQVLSLFLYLPFCLRAHTDKLT